MYTNWQKTGFGFTLLEILIVLAVIGILASMVLFNTADSGKQARDSQRQSDLRELQSAIELYKNKYGEYPAQCSAIAGSDGWSGQVGTDFECVDGTNNYIVGSVSQPFSEFMPKLPTDPRLNGDNSGYVYRVNGNKTVYKLMAMNTVESEIVNYVHSMRSCDIRATGPTSYPATDVNQIDIGGWCSQVHSSVYSGTYAPRAPWCLMSFESGSDGRYEKSYGVWGGFEPKLGGINEATKVRETTKVICK
ncbi:MAG: prepilin-type N-terminal cleavage/methylation domain-containing protein [Candidatus Paceibacterota bacterium]